jgi:hypothetical protein
MTSSVSADIVWRPIEHEGAHLGNADASLDSHAQLEERLAHTPEAPLSHGKQEQHRSELFARLRDRSRTAGPAVKSKTQPSALADTQNSSSGALDSSTTSADHHRTMMGHNNGELDEPLCASSADASCPEEHRDVEMSRMPSNAVELEADGVDSNLPNPLMRRRSGYRLYVCLDYMYINKAGQLGRHRLCLGYMYIHGLLYVPCCWRRVLTH